MTKNLLSGECKFIIGIACARVIVKMQITIVALSSAHKALNSHFFCCLDLRDAYIECYKIGMMGVLEGTLGIIQSPLLRMERQCQV